MKMDLIEHQVEWVWNNIVQVEWVWNNIVNTKLLLHLQNRLLTYLLLTFPLKI